METTYYELDAKQLTVYDMASGGSAPQSRPCLCLHRQEEPGPAGGVVVDLEAYRRAAEAPPAAEPEIPSEGAPPRSERRFQVALILDLCASLAVVIMAVAAVIRFLPLF